jgi:hypothetical protein
MHSSVDALRLFAVVFVVALLYGSRLVKGRATETPAGMVFAMKPMVVFARIAALLLYLSFFIYMAVSSGKQLPPWVFLVFAAAIGLGLLQYPGTITLGRQGLSQTFWFQKKKLIAYPEVMAIQRLAAGGAVRVVGDNRVIITHTNNHAASKEFQAAVEQRTGKTAV